MRVIKQIYFACVQCQITNGLILWNNEFKVADKILIDSLSLRVLSPQHFICHIPKPSLKCMAY